MAQTIAIAIPKGGVGKTTTAINLAASLAFCDQRTLLVDVDTSGASGLGLGFTEANTRSGVFEVFNFISGLNHTVHKTEIPNLHVVPSNVHTLLREERLMKLADNRLILKNAIRSVENEYDYIIIDCPPFLRGLTTNALTAADSVIVPVKSGHFALDAVDKFYKYVDWIREMANRMLRVEGILLTMYEPNTKVTEITTRELIAKYRKNVFETVIPRNSPLTEASFYGKPALLYDINSHGAQAYLDLAREITGKNGLEKPVLPRVIEHAVQFSQQA